MRRNNRLGKRNNEISLYAYDGMNILVGGNCPGCVSGGSYGGGGNYPKEIISWEVIVWGQSSGG